MKRTVPGDLARLIDSTQLRHTTRVAGPADTNAVSAYGLVMVLSTGHDNEFNSPLFYVMALDGSSRRGWIKQSWVEELRQ